MPRRRSYQHTSPTTFPPQNRGGSATRSRTRTHLSKAPQTAPRPPAVPRDRNKLARPHRHLLHRLRHAPSPDAPDAHPAATARRVLRAPPARRAARGVGERAARPEAEQLLHGAVGADRVPERHLPGTRLPTAVARLANRPARLPRLIPDGRTLFRMVGLAIAAPASPNSRARVILLTRGRRYLRLDPWRFLGLVC